MRERDHRHVRREVDTDHLALPAPPQPAGKDRRMIRYRDEPEPVRRQVDRGKAAEPGHGVAPGKDPGLDSARRGAALQPEHRRQDHCEARTD